jgi:hypothetical protein
MAGPGMMGGGMAGSGMMGGAGMMGGGGAGGTSGQTNVMVKVAIDGELKITETTPAKKAPVLAAAG